MIQLPELNTETKINLRRGSYDIVVSTFKYNYVREVL